MRRRGLVISAEDGVRQQGQTQFRRSKRAMLRQKSRQYDADISRRKNIHFRRSLYRCRKTCYTAETESGRFRPPERTENTGGSYGIIQ